MFNKFSCVWCTVESRFSDFRRVFDTVSWNIEKAISISNLFDSRFRLAVPALEQLKSEAKETLRKELAREFEVTLDQVIDFEEQCSEVEEAFNGLIEVPTRLENPRIYHLDVGAMYPNIILTNRLQVCSRDRRAHS